MGSPYTTTGRNGVTYWVLPEIQERWSPDGVELIRRLRCHWSDRQNFAEDLLGYHVWDQSSATFQRSLPEEDFDYTDHFAVDMHLVEAQAWLGEDVLGDPHYYQDDQAGNDPSGKTDGFAVYDVTFKPLMYDVIDDGDVSSELQRFVERDEKNSSESLRLPGQTFQWGNLNDTGQPPGQGVPAGLMANGSTSPGATIAEPTTRLVGISTLQYRWHLVPGRKVGNLYVLPRKNIQAGISCVNSTNFDAGFGPVLSGGQWVFPPETLLFESMEARRVRSAGGQILFEVTYNFVYRATGWNKALRRDPGNVASPPLDYFKIIVKGSSGNEGPYQTYEFANLFKFV